jgi:hypothetical protein
MKKILAVAVAAALLTVVLASPAEAEGKPAKPNPFTQSVTTEVTPTVVEQVALYVYEKKDASAPASWANSGTQHLVTVVDGTDWIQIDWSSLLPEGTCGDTDLAVQQDKVRHDGTFVFPDTLNPPTGLTVAPYESKHQDLADLVDVPACVVPTPTPEPTVTPTQVPEPTPTHAVAVAKAGPPPAELAATGSDNRAWALGTGVVVLGLVLILIARRAAR